LPVGHDVVIVEPYNAIARPFQKDIATLIAFNVLFLEMLSAIELDHKHCRTANEIDDVGTDGRLAPETRTLHAIAAQCRPNFSLRIGGLAT
jgi:hypothetical protein